MEEDDEWFSGAAEEVIPGASTPMEVEHNQRLYHNARNNKSGYKSDYAPYHVMNAGAFNGSRGKKDMVPMKTILDVAATSVIDVGATYQIGQKFLVETEGDILYGEVNVTLNATDFPFIKVLEVAKKVLSKETRAFQNGSGHFVTVNGDYNGSPILFWINYNKDGGRHRRRINNIDAAEVKFEIMAAPDALEKFSAYLENSFASEKIAKIKWWTQAGHGPQTREIYLPSSNTKILPEFYPDMVDPEKYLEDYLNSDKSILLLAGAPGTGKTTLLRHLILDHKLSAHVIYDESLMQNDNVFQNFLFEMDDEIMIIEDADTILSDREKDGNKLMSRFLNVSDGLIKLPNKKLVFTTNISDFQRIDPALLRPGRCYGTVHTRALNLTEAQAAAKVAGLPVPMEKREYTIAELFNQTGQPKLRRVGFVG
jgi:hypothetical protein